MVQRMSNPALTKQWYLDAQWSDLPEEVYKLVEYIWRWAELGNDRYIFKTSVFDLENIEEDGFESEIFKWGETKEEQEGWVKEKCSLRPLINYLQEKGVKEDELVLIHWWW